MNTFGGMRIIESVYLTEAEARTVRRTLRERWLSWPWRPWQVTKTVTVQVPSMTGYMLDAQTCVMHPVTAARVRDELKRGTLQGTGIA